MRNLRQLLKDVWYLTKPYFVSEDRKWAWGLLAAVLVLTFSLIGLGLLQTFSQNVYYTALQQRDARTFLLGLFWFVHTEHGLIPGFFLIAIPGIVIGIYTTYLQQLLRLRWRRWLTRRLTAQWMEHQTYFRMAMTLSGLEAGADNPDQRIQEDLDSFINDTLTLFISLLSNLVTVVSYAGLLWVLSGPLRFHGFTIPGYFFWTALLYSVVATWITHLVGRNLAKLQFRQQKVEADFRYGLVHVRDNAEGIALSHGEPEEQAGLGRHFSLVYTNFLAIMRRTKLLGFLTGGLDVVSGNFALLVGSIRYFQGATSFGTLMQLAQVFARVQGAMGWFSSSYAGLAGWYAEVERLATFQRTMHHAAGITSRCVTLPGSPASDLTLDGMTIFRPDGSSLLEGVSVVLPRGGTIAVTGPSGTGKSTLFRLLAGIWPFADGRITRPDTTIMFLPQRACVPVGALIRAVCYPRSPSEFSADAVEAALESVGLSSLIPHLGDEAPWSQRLSPGELQRLAFARIMLSRPEWVFLDEATSSLDVAAEKMLYALLRKTLPGITIVSITHRLSILESHDIHVDLAGYRHLPRAATI